MHINNTTVTANKLIRNSQQIKQIVDFGGIENGNIHPTDIDGVLEFDNQALILLEIKYKGATIPTGQRLTLERISDSWHTGKSIILKIEHKYTGVGDIPIQDCRITKIYLKKKWYNVNYTDVIAFLNVIGEKWNIKKCKF